MDYKLLKPIEKHLGKAGTYAVLHNIKQQAKGSDSSVNRLLLKAFKDKAKMNTSYSLIFCFDTDKIDYSKIYRAISEVLEGTNPQTSANIYGYGDGSKHWLRAISRSVANSLKIDTIQFYRLPSTGWKRDIDKNITLPIDYVEPALIISSAGEVRHLVKTDKKPFSDNNFSMGNVILAVIQHKT